MSIILSQEITIVILGSSSKQQSLLHNYLKEKKLKAFNYRMSGGHLFETSLILKV
jgi:hypothetical protein